MKTCNHFKKLFSIARQKSIRGALKYDLDVTLRRSNVYVAETGCLAGFIYLGIEDLIAAKPECNENEKGFQAAAAQKPATEDNMRPKTSRRLLKYLQPSHYL